MGRFCLFAYTGLTDRFRHARGFLFNLASLLKLIRPEKNNVLILEKIYMIKNRSSFLSRLATNETNCSNDIGSFDSFRNKFFAQVISCFKSFSLNEYDLRILPSVFLIEIFMTSGAKSWNTRKNCLWIITENPYKIPWGCRTCVGSVKTVVTNHLRKMFRRRTHKAAVRNSAARKKLDKLTETNS